MSELIQRRIMLAPEMEQALQQLAEITSSADGQCLQIETTQPMLKGKYSFHLGFVGQVCVAELRALGSTTPLITDEASPKQVKLTNLVDAVNKAETQPRRRRRRNKVSVAAQASLQYRLRDELVKVPSATVVDLVSALGFADTAANRVMFRRALDSMRDVRHHRPVGGGRSFHYYLKAIKIAATKSQKPTVATGPMTGTRQPSKATGMPPNPVTTEAMMEGTNHLDRKVEERPVCKNLAMARLDGYWRTLFQSFGSADITGDEAASVLNLATDYTIQILRHMCYLGCADNRPRSSRYEPRRFFLVGTPGDSTRDLLNRTNKNGAATSEPPPAVTKRPSIAAAIRARRAQA